MSLRINRLTRAGAVLFASAGVLFATAGTASADTYTVTTTSDGGTGSLRAAIVAADQAGGSSTINVPAGTYSLTIPSTASTATDFSDDPLTGDLDIDNNASITIAGAGAGQTIIDPARNDRAFAIHQGASLSISGVTIQHGESDDTTTDVNSDSAGYGGAIYNDGSLTLSDSSLIHDSAFDYGGAIYSDYDATSTSITDSTLSSDSADGAGGAVYIDDGSLSLTGDTFTNDSGYGGGAIYDDPSTPATVTISDSSFTDDNGSYSEGGAVYLQSTLPATVTGSSFTNDSSADGDGGAIYTDSADISIASSSFTNDSAWTGGALYLDGASAFGSGHVPNETITNSTFSGNSAYDGGAVYPDYGWLSVTDSTLTQNQANYGGAFEYESGDGFTLADDTLTQNTSSGQGAAIYFGTTSSYDPIALTHDTIADNSDAYGGAVYDPSHANTIKNTIIADNTAQTREGGADCQNGADYGESSNFTDAGNNLDSDGSCFGGDASHGAAGDLTSVDPLLSLLADNGGPVETMALQPGSPAIGAASGCTGTDARGVALPANCDIGAFQTAATDLSVSGSGPASGVPGAPVSYTFTVTNHGPGDDAGVTLTDPLPAGAQYFGATASQGSCAGTATVTCDLGTLDSGASATVTIAVIPQANGTLSNTATVSGEFTDPTSSNDSATVTTTVATPATIATSGSAPVPFMVRPSTAGTHAAGVKKTSATLVAYVDAGNGATTWWFQYGKSRHFGKVTRKRHLSAGTAVRTTKVRLTHLKAHTTYYFRIVVRNAKGQTHSGTVKFKTRR